jgi:16S rRNA (uracil1498-N3)-methyltransferase
VVANPPRNQPAVQTHAKIVGRPATSPIDRPRAAASAATDRKRTDQFSTLGRELPSAYSPKNNRVNLLLFTPDEATAPLPRTDPRATHLLDVLRRQIGDTFDAGLIDGPRGKGTLTAISPTSLALTFAWGEPPPPLDPIALLIGLPRPQTARKILQEATALGVSALHFFASARGEPSYAQSTLWSSGEWRRHLITGAEQAFCTRLPEVTWARPLADVIASPPLVPTHTANEPAPPACTRIALDNYESPAPLSHSLDHCNASRYIAPTGVLPVITLAIGSERGWSPAERDLLRAKNFTLAHLGPRVLRAETAVTAAVAIVKARLGLM